MTAGDVLESTRSREAAPKGEHREDRPLSSAERRLLALVTLPSFSFSLAVTVVAALLPVVLKNFVGPLVTGLVIGIEGLLALVVPPFVGPWSDRIRSRLGPRLPFLIALTPPLVVVLILLPLVGSVALIAGLVAIFYGAYFAYLSAHAALLADVVPEAIRGRAMSALGLWREAGLGVGLVAGGLLLSFWQPLPFLIAAGTVAAVTLLLVVRLRRRAVAGPSPAGDKSRNLRQLAADGQVRLLLAANALWEVALGALRTFALLFLTDGLDRGPGFAALVLAGVAATAVIAAPVAGTLADRRGHLRVLRPVVWVYGIGLLVPFFTQSFLVLIALPLVAFAAATVMTLPLGLVLERIDGDHGVVSAAFTASRGVGLLGGPILAGAAITLLRPLLPETQGYAAIFLVASIAVLLSAFLLTRLDRDRRTAGHRTGSRA